nr:hypothetical protein [Tanacetum cinerariifolium]
MKALKEKVEDKLYKQDQSLQIVHMMCKPKSYYDEQSNVAIGYKYPLYLTRAQQVQPALYNGHETIKTNHVPVIVHNSKETLKIAEITRKKMNEKIKDPEYVLKEQTIASSPIKALMVYPPNTPATLIPMISRGNTIHELREKISRLTKKHNDAVPIHDLKALDSQNKELYAKVVALYDLNEHWRVKNEKVNRHYQELYDSIKITHAKTIKKTNSLLTEVANLEAHIQENHILNCVTMPAVKLKVLAPGRYSINIKPIPPHIRNNREVQLDYLKHLKESMETLREIVEEAKVERPLDRSLA